MGYPLSVRGQVRRAQGPLPCVAATVLCSWRPPSLGRVPMNSVPRRRRSYEGATTSHPASRSLLVRDRVPRGPPRFVLAEALPSGWRSRPSLGRLVRRRPGSGWRPRGRGGISQVPRRSIPCLCPAQRPRPNQWSLTKAVPPMLPPRPTRRRLQRSHDLEAATGLQHPLPTLRTRRCRCLRKARFRLAGWPLPGEGRTLRIATKGFRALSRHPPFQGLPCRKLGSMPTPAAFAVESIRRWWHKLGQARYPEAKRLVITADCGGSNGARLRLWKRELQRFATETGLAVTVAHLPPGTSKWNLIEHRLLAYISQNWRGKPLVSHQVIVQLIGATTTQTGLTVRCEIDASRYPKGIKVTATEMAALAIERDPFHGEWNYTISPNQHPP